ncbi:S-adenosyl-L-methionine-dependent methyltransferase [Xylariaceae sp. AK1471]|nr:S-adenosyl-L-methionine-dependent methyltransferase [Xylariaceae sp. AK1471]
MAASRIVELASRIATNTNKVNDYLVAHNLPTPSFDVDGAQYTLIPKDELDVERARIAIIDDTLELRRLALGPREYLMSYTHDELISQQATTRFRIAHSFPVGREASFAEIAAATGLPEDVVRRLIRHAIIKDIFQEPRPGIIAHNAVSRLLAEDQVTHDWVAASTDDLWQAAAQTCNALEKWPGSEEPNETFPERARRFGNAMKSFTEGTGFELDHVVEGYPWGDLKDGTVVDVGGSRGFASFAIARKFPSLSFVVQDLEPVRLMAHDFFTEQPIAGADVNHIPALKSGAKIIINDNVLPQPGSMSKWQEDRLRSMDLTMTEIQNSREREVDDWARLLKTADIRFEFLEAKQPPGSNLWLVVAEWKG